MDQVRYDRSIFKLLGGMTCQQWCRASSWPISRATNLSVHDVRNVHLGVREFLCLKEVTVGGLAILLGVGPSASSLYTCKRGIECCKASGSCFLPSIHPHSYTFNRLYAHLT